MKTKYTENKDMINAPGKQLKMNLEKDNTLIFQPGEPINIKVPTEGLIRRIKKAGVHLEDARQITPENINVHDVQELLTNPDYKIRFIGEYWELHARIRSLNAMVVKYKAGTLDFTPSCKYGILSTQLRHMKNYLESLKVRAAIEEIDLNSVFTLIYTLKDNYTDVVVYGSKENIPTVHVICKDNLSNINVLSEDVQTGELTKVNSKPAYSVENDGKYIECIII